MSGVRLGVNVDHIATVRQARRGTFPDPVEAARLCLRAGAAHIVCHLREDRRHIHDEDVRRLKRTLGAPLNLEMSMASDIVKVALAVRPDWVTLVPERRQELTTEGGLDVARHLRRLRQLIASFHARGIGVSLFVDPEARQVEAAGAAGARSIELHTGRYANVRPAERVAELDALARAARLGRRLGLSVAAGHGLDYENVPALVRIGEIDELNIGFSLIARALFVGIEQAVREMVARLPQRHAPGRAEQGSLRRRRAVVPVA